MSPKPNSIPKPSKTKQLSFNLEQLQKQIQQSMFMIYDNRNKIIELNEKLELLKLRHVSEMEVLLKTIAEGLVIEESEIIKKISEKYDKNIEIYNEAVRKNQEKIEEDMKKLHEEHVELEKKLKVKEEKVTVNYNIKEKINDER